jgi:hypothetical protein
MNPTTYLLFLDDVRVPIDVMAYDPFPVYLRRDWEVVRSYAEFETRLRQDLQLNRWPSLISFDHDLADVHYSHLDGTIPYDQFSEKTGYHCAQLLIELCRNHHRSLPNYRCHSMNPAGKKNILSLLEQFSRL